MGEAGRIPATRLAAPKPLALADDDLAVFVLNVGDGDAIVVRLPDAGTGPAYAVIDAYKGDKTVQLLRDLHGAPTVARPIRARFICATHPHLDHIAGLRYVIRELFDGIEEFWDSGFRFTSTTYQKVMRAAEASARAHRTRIVRPTSGFEFFHGETQVTVLSPSIQLRNRYDTYGVDVNNASIVMRIRYPVAPPSSDYPPSQDSGEGETSGAVGSGTAAAGGSAGVGSASPTPTGGTDGNGDEDGAATDAAEPRTIILGGDAQSDAWGQVLAEFPHLFADPDIWARKIGSGSGNFPLACDFLKVSHHGSKRGVSLELLERMGHRGGIRAGKGPALLATSSATGTGSTYGFPHAVTQELMREVRQPLAGSSSGTRKSDDRLGIHSTAQIIDPSGSPAGSIGYVVGHDRTTKLYRFADAIQANVDLTTARQLLP